MKKWVGVIVLCFAIASCLGQTQYTFDHIVIKVILNSEDSETNEGQTGERFSLVNATTDNYSAEVGLLPSGKYFIQLKDKKHNIFGRGIISKDAFLNNESYVIKDSYTSRFPQVSQRMKRSKHTVDTIGPTQTVWQFRRNVELKKYTTLIDEYTVDNERFKTFQSKGFDRFKRRGRRTFNGWVTSYRCLDEEGAVLSHWVVDTIIPTKRFIVLKD